MVRKCQTDKYRRRRKRELANKRANEHTPGHPLYQRRMESRRNKLAQLPHSLLEHIRRTAPPGSDLKRLAEDVSKED